jgi:tetratricopeptide (TPR) repeat protein
MSLRPAVALALLVSACASSPGPEPGSPPSPFPAPYPGLPPHAETPAIASLMEGARTETAAGRPANAAASLERALRIEPRNPRLWQELSRVRLRQRDYVQAESCAARSNSWAGSDDALRAENWRLIAQAREARGDAEGAKAALEAIERLR